MWRGGASSSLAVPVSVGALRSLSNYADLESLILKRAKAGDSDDEIAQALSGQGFRSTRTDRLLPSTVKSIRLQHGLVRRYDGPRPRNVDGYLTVPQLARALNIKVGWIYNKIYRGVIQIQRESKSKMYLFPDRPETREEIRQLKAGHIKQLSY